MSGETVAEARAARIAALAEALAEKQAHARHVEMQMDDLAAVLARHEQQIAEMARELRRHERLQAAAQPADKTKFYWLTVVASAEEIAADMGVPVEEIENGDYIGSLRTVGGISKLEEVEGDAE